MTDQAAIYTKLRAEAAKLLNLDVANLSALQSMHVDLVGVLMLEIDGLQAQQLANKSVDIGKLTDVVKLLRSLLPQATEVKPADMAVESDARAALEALINRQVAALAARSKREEVIYKRENEELREQNAKLRNDLAAAAPPTSPAQPTSPDQLTSAQSNQPPLPPPSSTPPAGYLRRTDGFDVIQGGRYDRWSNRG